MVQTEGLVHTKGGGNVENRRRSGLRTTEVGFGYPIRCRTGMSDA